jgi:GNAT superfamily N-acetyltransferase
MALVLATVDAAHALSLGNMPAKVLKDLSLNVPVPFTATAYAGRRLVGFLRYEFNQFGTLCASGTWVDPRHRKDGVAALLWRYVLDRVRPRRVWVRTVTPGGRALVTALMREKRRIRWEVVG